MKIYWCVALTLVSLLLSGCQQFKDIDKRFLVLAIGIDEAQHKHGKYDVTLKLAIPTGTPKLGQEQFQLVTVVSNSLGEAMQLAETNVDRDLEFGHTKALIIGKSVAEQDVYQIIDWMTRVRYIQEISWLGIGEPSAKDILSVKPPFERLPSNAPFLTFGREGIDSEYIVTETLYEFFRDYYEQGVSPVLPRIAVRDGHFVINRASVFDKGKAAYLMTPPETRLYKLFEERVESTVFTVKTKENLYGVNISQFTVSYSIDAPDEKLCTIQAKVKMHGLIEERFQDKKLSEKEMNEIEKQLEHDFNGESLKFFQTMQQRGLDPIGFGLLYRSHKWQDYKTEVNAWKKLYPKAKFAVQSNVVIESTGTIR